MRLKKKLLSILIPLILGAILSAYMGGNQLQKSKDPTTTAATREQIKGISSAAIVTKVIDGDTFTIDTGQKVRMIGIDTPETSHPTKGVQCYGKEAKNKTTDILEGKAVRLEKDVSETDRYGRLLRFVYLLNLSPTPLASQSAEMFVNEYLVREGYAHAVTFPPDVAQSEYFKTLEREAMYNNKGLWKDCQ